MKNVNTDSSVGNAAATREALNKVGNAAAWIAERCNDQQTAKYMNDIIAIVQTAIAKPARNCDVYKNKKDAEAAFLSEECRHPCGCCTVSDDYGCALVHDCGVDWLFAPAAERKGECDGR